MTENRQGRFGAEAWDQSASTAERPRDRRLRVAIWKYRGRLLLALAIGSVITATVVALSEPAQVAEACILVHESSADILSLNPTHRFGERPDGMTLRDYIAIQARLLNGESIRMALAQELVQSGALAPGGLADGAGISHGPSGLFDRFLAAIGIAPESRPGDSAPPAVGDVAAVIGASLDVQSTPTSPLITIRYSGPTATNALEVLRRLLTVYETQRRSLYSLAPAIAALENDVTEAEGALSSEVAAFEAFCREKKIDEIQAQKAALTDTVVTLDRDRQLQAVHLNEAKAKLEQYRSAMTMVPKEVASLRTVTFNPRKQDLEKDRDRLKLELLGTQFPPSSPAHANLTKQVEYIEQQLVGLPDTIALESGAVLNSAYVTLETQALEAEADVKAYGLTIPDLAQRIDDVNARLEELRKATPEVVRLSNRVDIARGRRDDAIRASENVKREKEFSDAKVLASQRVLQGPFLPDAGPAGLPKKTLVVGFGLTVLLALGWAMMSGLLDRTLRTPGDLLPVCGVKAVAVFPDLRRRRDVRQFERRLGSVGSSGSQSRVPRFGRWKPARVGAGVFDLGTGTLGGQLDRIVLQLPGDRAAARPAAVVVFGAEPGAGATTVATNLAIRIARSGVNRVLLVAWGTGDAAAGNAGRNSREAAAPGIGAGVDRMCLSDRSGDEGDARRVAEALEAGAGRTRYDAIVLDGGSIAGDGTRFLRLAPVELAVLVVKADSTPHPRITEAVELLSTVPSLEVAIVLNGRHYPAPRWVDGEA